MDPVTALVVVAFGVLAVQRVLELRLAKRNEAWARAEGAKEFGARHYPAFFVLHGGWLVGWVVEGLRRDALPPRWWLWVAVFCVAQGLRYWAISTLGKRWNTRVLVLPGRPPILRGPYRLIPHPNYLAVALELAAVPLSVGAIWTAAISTVLNAVLLIGVRIPCESRALRWATAGGCPESPAEDIL